MKPTTLVFPIDEQHRNAALALINIMALVVKSMLVKAFANAPFVNYMRNRAFLLMLLI